MKRLRTYHQFKQDKLIKEEFIGKLWRKITGADAKEIAELTDKIKSEYNSYDDELGKKEFNRYIRLYVNNNNLNNKYEDILKGGDWYGDINYFVKRFVGGGIDKIKKDLKGMLGYLQDRSSDIKETVDKSLIEKKVKDINDKIDKYNNLLDKNYKELLKFNEDYIAQKFESILKRIPGCPDKDFSFTSDSGNAVENYVSEFYPSQKDNEFIKSDGFIKLEEKFRNRNSIIKETGVLELWNEIDNELGDFYKDDKLRNFLSEIKSKPQKVNTYDEYQNVINWAKESLSGKTVGDVLRSILNEKSVFIERSDSKETKQEGDKLVAGNIVYSGQNFNNLTLDKLTRFINKEGYKESYSGKSMYVTNNIPYAFYYCHLRFGLEFQKVTENLFPTIYKITLKPGTEFFYKGDTGIDEEEFRSGLICGVSGFHSGNKIVNRQSVEISLFTADCIESIEAIKPEELIRYLDSPELKSDNEWIETERFRTSQHEINWYKNLVSSYYKK